MKRYTYKKVNAFTSDTSKGNPAAYLMLGRESLSDAQMLEIGKEHQGFVSEVVFCEESAKADKKLTYYSSQCEVDFCGHGTIATMYDLIAQDVGLRQKAEITIETNRKGILTVYNSLNEEDAVYITAPAAIHHAVPTSIEWIADALELKMADIDAAYPIGFIDAGLRTLLVPIKEYEKEISIYPDEARLKNFCKENEIDIILIFSKASNTAYIAHTRVFAPKFGYLEDPATGSGNSAFANYLLKNKLWNGSPAMVEQGGNNIVYNTVRIKTHNDSILFGGKATTIIDGEYLI